MPRAQVIVHRGKRLLLVKHREQGHEYWCLPGGGIEAGEAPEVAALRELAEECSVRGQIIRRTAHTQYSAGDECYTFLVDVGDQEVRLGHDPEYQAGQGILLELGWMTLAELSETDRVYLWAAGLLGVPEIFQEVQSWVRAPSYPATR